jgi:antitoxin Phd
MPGCVSAVVDDAVRGVPCVIARDDGRCEAVVIAYEEWGKLSRVPSFGRLLMAAPLEAGATCPSVIVSLLQSRHFA